MLRASLLMALLAPGMPAAATPASGPAAQDSAAAPTLVATTERFALHSHPWVGLHHLLFEWARSELPRSPRDTRPLPVIGEKSRRDQWTDDERAEWAAALDYYGTSVAHRSLVFDADLVSVKTALSELRDAADEPPRELGELGVALAAAMPIYERYFWAEHDRQNRAQIAELVRGLARFETGLAERLARAFGGGWPAAPIRVDVARCANWAGAYTTGAPDHVVIASAAPDLEGWLALELLFHEVCHTEGLGGRLGPELDAAFGALEAEPPRDLWHALIFYTAGELTRDALSAAGIAGYEAYAERLGFYGRPSWSGYRTAFDGHWRPWLKGERERVAAYAGLAASIASR